MDFGGIWWHSFGMFRHFWYHQCVQRCWQPHLVALFLCGRSVDKGNRVQDGAPHTISGGLIQPFAYSRWALKTTTTVTNKISPPAKNTNEKNDFSSILSYFTDVKANSNNWLFVNNNKQATTITSQVTSGNIKESSLINNSSIKPNGGGAAVKQLHNFRFTFTSRVTQLVQGAPNRWHQEFQTIPQPPTR